MRGAAALAFAAVAPPRRCATWRRQRSTPLSAFGCTRRAARRSARARLPPKKLIAAVWSPTPHLTVPRSGTPRARVQRRARPHGPHARVEERLTAPSARQFCGVRTSRTSRRAARKPSRTYPVLEDGDVRSSESAMPMPSGSTRAASCTSRAQPAPLPCFRLPGAYLIPRQRADGGRRQQRARNDLARQAASSRHAPSSITRIAWRGFVRASTPSAASRFARCRSSHAPKSAKTPRRARRAGWSRSGCRVGQLGSAGPSAGSARQRACRGLCRPGRCRCQNAAKRPEPTAAASTPSRRRRRPRPRSICAWCREPRRCRRGREHRARSKMAEQLLLHLAVVRRERRGLGPDAAAAAIRRPPTRRSSASRSSGGWPTGARRRRCTASATSTAATAGRR